MTKTEALILLIKIGFFLFHGAAVWEWIVFARTLNKNESYDNRNSDALANAILFTFLILVIYSVWWFVSLPDTHPAQ